MKIDLEIQYDGGLQLPFEDLAGRVCEAVLAASGCNYDVEISVLLCDNETIQQINRETRGIDSVTDVLSFPSVPFSEPYGWEAVGTLPHAILFDPDTDLLQLGEIIVCADKVRGQAEEYGHSEEREFAFLVTHSMLHLLGFDHEEETDRIRMEEEQRKILGILGISR